MACRFKRGSRLLSHPDRPYDTHCHADRGVGYGTQSLRDPLGLSYPDRPWEIGGTWLSKSRRGTTTCPLTPKGQKIIAKSHFPPSGAVLCLSLSLPLPLSRPPLPTPESLSHSA
eukprot:988816-Rhodomonas_salina.1